MTKSIEIFYEFLVKENLLFRYTSFVSMERLQKEYWVTYLLLFPSSSTSWSKTDEGYAYWSNIHTKWEEYYNEKIKPQKYDIGRS